MNHGFNLHEIPDIEVIVEGHVEVDSEGAVSIEGMTAKIAKNVEAEVKGVYLFAEGEEIELSPTEIRQVYEAIEEEVLK